MGGFLACHSHKKIIIILTIFDRNSVLVAVAVAAAVVVSHENLGVYIMVRTLQYALACTWVGTIAHFKCHAGNHINCTSTGIQE